MNIKHRVISLTSTIALGAALSVVVVIDATAADANKLAEACADCHGKDGASTESEVPIIGGFSAQYLIDSMAAYVNKDRPCPEAEYHEGPHKGDKTDMCKIADEISEDDVKEIAKYFAAKPFVRAKQKFDPALAEKGKLVHDDLCEKCHGDGGNLASDDAGILAGQWIPYLEATFKDYSTGDRAQPKKMKKKMDKLDDTSTNELIHYYGSFK